MIQPYSTPKTKLGNPVVSHNSSKEEPFCNHFKKSGQKGFVVMRHSIPFDTLNAICNEICKGIVP